MSSYSAGQVTGAAPAYGQTEGLTRRANYNTLIALFAGTVLGCLGTFLLEAAFIAAIR